MNEQSSSELTLLQTRLTVQLFSEGAPRHSIKYKYYTVYNCLARSNEYNTIRSLFQGLALRCQVTTAGLHYNVGK